MERTPLNAFNTRSIMVILDSQGAVPAGAELCGGDEMAKSIHDSFERLKAGDESAAIFKKDVGELMVRPIKN